MSIPTVTLGAQFPPVYHRPFLRYFNGDQGGAPAAPPATPAPPAAPAPSAPPAAAPQAPAAPPAAPAAPPAPAAPTPQAPVQYQGNPDEYVRQLREENRERREALSTTQTQLTAAQTDLTAAQTALADSQRVNAVLRLAPKAGANADALLDSTSFMTALAAVDLSKEDDVTAAITTALEKNSALKAAPALPSTNGGGAQGGTNATPTTLEGAIAATFQQ